MIPPSKSNLHYFINFNKELDKIRRKCQNNTHFGERMLTRKICLSWVLRLLHSIIFIILNENYTLHTIRIRIHKLQKLH